MSTEAQRNAANGSGNMFTMSADLSEIAPVAPIARNGYAPFAKSTPDTLVSTDPIVAPSVNGLSLLPDGSTSFAGPVRAPGFANSSELPNLRSGLSAVLSGESDAQINLIGDSWTYGFYGQPGVCLPLGQILKTLLPPALNPVLGWVPLNSSSDLWPTDTWTLSAGWQAALPATMGFGSGCGKNATNPTGAIVFNPRETCDQIDVMFVCAPGYGSATIQATGGSPVVVDCNKSVQTFVATCSAATAAMNTVSITGTGQIIVLACRARNTAKKQLYINNLGAGGTQISRWDDPPEGYQSVDALAFTAPCLSIVHLGINDGWANSSAEDFRINYETFLDQRNPAGTDYILCAPGNVNPLAVGALGIPVETSLAQYREIVKNLGRSRNLRVIDVPSILPYVESDWSDWSHPKRAKYAAIAVAYSKEIL